MGLAHTIDRRDGQVTVVLAGEADATTAGQLRDVLFDAAARRPARITVDIRGLVFIDAGSIGAFVAARRAALERDCAFLVTNTRGQVRHVLTVVGVLTTLTRAEVPGQAGGAGVAPGV